VALWGRSESQNSSFVGYSGGLGRGLAGGGLVLTHISAPGGLGRGSGGFQVGGQHALLGRP
jgi:hypothetical protein